ncbi:MAG: formylglycine-generating enzyme family protein [Akkermansiaceae bacterium]
MFKLSHITTTPALALTLAFSIQNVSVAQDDPQPEPAADVKPALNNQNLDEEELRLAKVIHKRITDYQQIKNKTNDNKPQPFAPYKETTKTGAQFEMLPVKAGTFTWKGDQDGDTLEVSLSPFWMGKTEVTWEEYEPFMLSEIPRQKDGQVLDFMRDSIENDIDFIARPTPPYHPMTYGMPRDGHPAISMTQHAANKYCQWLSFQTGHFYRLPTEAEWEYACRANSKTKYTWGDNSEDADQYVWLGGDPASHYNKPGLKKPNAWGFQDMQGNVLEWTLDQYVPNRKAYFAKDNVTNPWVKATKPYPHVTKGGHWKQPLADITAASRTPSTDKWKQTDPQNPKSQWYHTDTPWLGLRIVRPAKIPSAEEMYHYWNSGVAEDDF